MKKTVLTFSLALLISSAAFCQQKIVKSEFGSGFAKEIKVEDFAPYHTIEKSTNSITMLHDDNSLYIRFVVKDKHEQMKYLIQGLTVYIDTKGKQNKKAYVKFPNAGKEMMKGGAGPQGGQDDMPQRQGGEDMQPGERGPEVNIKEMLFKMMLEPATFYKDKDEIILNNTVASVVPVGDMLVYTCAIPYSYLGKVNKKKNISLGIVSEFSMSGDRPDKSQGMGNPPSGGNGGNRPAGGPGGGGPGGMSGGPGGMSGGPGGMQGGRPGGGTPPSGGQGQQGGNNTSQATPQWVVFTLR